MRRLTQWVISWMTGLSLLMCIVVAVLWVDSYRAAGALYYRMRLWEELPRQNNARRFGQTNFEVNWMRGQFAAVRYHMQMDEPMARAWRSTPRGPGPFVSLIDHPERCFPRDQSYYSWNLKREWHGFEYCSDANPVVISHGLVIPLWSLVLCLAFAPTVWAVVGRRGQQRHPPGLCSACGYDLRATLERCPECGAVPRVEGVA